MTKYSLFNVQFDLERTCKFKRAPELIGVMCTGVAKYASLFLCITFVFVRAKISEKSMMNGIVRTHFIVVV